MPKTKLISFLSFLPYLFPSSLPSSHFSLSFLSLLIIIGSFKQTSTKVGRRTGITNPHAPITEVQPLLTCGQSCFSSLQPCIILKPIPDIDIASFQLCLFQCLSLKDKASFFNTIILPIGSHRK